MNNFNQYVRLDNNHGNNEYHIDVRAAAEQWFSEFYDEAVYLNTNVKCSFSFYREGELITFIQY